jgi:hypothetical protein
MRHLLFAAAVLAVLSPSARADGFDDALASGNAAAAQAKQAMARSEADLIVCPKSKDFGELRFSPNGGGNWTSLNDYRSYYVRDARMHFDAWSCDTQDYSFDFAVADVKREQAGQKSRPVKVHARQETRGTVDFDGQLDCTAYFK